MVFSYPELIYKGFSMKSNCTSFKQLDLFNQIQIISFFPKRQAKKVVTRSELKDLCHSKLRNKFQASFGVVFLDSENRLISFNEFKIKRGLRSISTRSIIEKAIALNARSVAFTRNDLNIYEVNIQEDINYASKLFGAMELIEVGVQDYIILSGRESHSLVEGGEFTQVINSLSRF